MAKGDPWPVDLLTVEYLVSGEVDEEAQKWRWRTVPAEVLVGTYSLTGSLASTDGTVATAHRYSRKPIGS